MKRRVYYAHPVGHYFTFYENLCLDAIRVKLEQHYGDQLEILNPSGDAHTAQYKAQGFQYFHRLIDSCDALVAAPFRDGQWGMGVFSELKHAIENHKDVFVVESLSPWFWVYSPTVRVFTWKDFEAVRPLSINQSRARKNAGTI